MGQESPASNSLPLLRKLKPIFILSLLITLATASTSLVGLLNTSTIYPNVALQSAFATNDIVNLIIGVPFLLGTMWATSRHKLNGLLYWPGALLYVLYNHITYLFAMPQSWAFVVHLLIVAATIYTVVVLFMHIDSQKVKSIIEGALPAKFTGGVLAGLGIVFLLRGASTVGTIYNGHSLVGDPDVATLIADSVLALIWIIGGIALWRHRTVGYAVGPALLFNVNLLFLALIVLMLIQTLTTIWGYALIDFVVIIVMALVCLVPLGLYIHNMAQVRATRQ